jgi:glycosyltransferase involved in cell wall biosynthesis
MSDPASLPQTIRVRIQQPALPAYRVPVFAELARRPGIELDVLFSASAKLPNVAAQGFGARQVAERRLLTWPREVRWVSAQMEAVDPANADVAILEYNSGVPSLLPAIRKAHKNGVGVVLWGHGYSVRDTTASRRLRNWLGTKADAVLLYNHEARQRMIAEGFPAERIFVALNALDQGPIQAARERWLADPAGLAAFQREQGLEGRPVVLFVSRLYADNRVDLLLHAVARLADRCPDLVAAIVGDGQERESLRALAERLGIADRVRMPGAVYGEEHLAPWFLSAGVFCYPTFIGLSVLHALGYGVPVVTNRDMWAHPPEAQILEDRVNGLLVDLGEPGSLGEAIATLVENPERAGQMGEAGRQKVLEQNTLATMVDGHEAAIRYALQNARKRAHSR